MAGSDDDGKLSAADLSRAALKMVQDLTGYKAEAVTGLEWDGDKWDVTVEVLELTRVPNTTDVIGTYEVQIDERGTLRGYRRSGRHYRGQVDQA